MKLNELQLYTATQCNGFTMNNLKVDFQVYGPISNVKGKKKYAKQKQDQKVKKGEKGIRQG